MTEKERIKKFREFLHLLQFNAEVVMNSKNVQRLINNACSWSYAHRIGNGEFTDAAQMRIVDQATTRLCDLDNA